MGVMGKHYGASVTIGPNLDLVCGLSQPSKILSNHTRACKLGSWDPAYHRFPIKSPFPIFLYNWATIFVATNLIKPLNLEYF